MWTSRKYQSIKASAGARAYNGGLGQKPGQASPPEDKCCSTFESPAAEQNVPDSVYVAVHTGVNHAVCMTRS